MKTRGVKVARPIDWRLVLTNSVRGVGLGLGLGWVRLLAPARQARVSRGFAQLSWF